MGGLLGLDYSALYPLLDRICIDEEDWKSMFADIKAMEAAAIDQSRCDGE